MEQPTIYNLSAPKSELIRTPKSSKPITASEYEFRSGFIAMVRDQAFSGLEYENPYTHYGSLSNSVHASLFRACHKIHCGGNCFRSLSTRRRNIGTPKTSGK